jgi:hypothetical protein
MMNNEVSYYKKRKHPLPLFFFVLRLLITLSFRGLNYTHLLYKISSSLYLKPDPSFFKHAGNKDNYE